MAEGNKELSIDFYNYVSNIIGTEKVIRKRRKIFTSMDCVKSDNEMLWISSGSKAEGLDLKGSDVDVMLCRNDIRVYEDQSKAFLPKRSTINLIMDINATKPGFALLRSVTPNLGDLFHGNYLSSKSFREYCRAKVDDRKTWIKHVGFVIHGPCINSSDGSIDTAMCFRCQEWISPAKQWIYRPRNLWPYTSTIQQIVDYGVLFVPIGCKGSPKEYLEWRISFSVAEKELIYTFNHVQFLCYALLKIALNDVIKKRYRDLLCSYFLKTIMFWMCEESDQSTWKPENFIKCYMNCFRRLVYCVKYKICLHYFIPDNNFFEDRFSASQHDGLFSYLQSLKHSRWFWILYTDTLQSYTRYYNLMICSPTVSSFQNLDIAKLLLPFEINENTYALMKKSVYCSGLSGNNLFIYHCSAISKHLAQTMLHYEECNKGNKQRYLQYRRCRGYLMIGLNTDVVSGWLLFASLLYAYKQYRECLYVLEYCLSKCTIDKILLTYKPDVEDQSRFERILHILGRGKFLSICKHCLIDDIWVWKTSLLLPAEMICVLGMTEVTELPSVVFAKFLRFLCFCHLGNQREKVEAFRELQLSVIERNFIRQDHININLHADVCFHIAQQMLKANS